MPPPNPFVSPRSGSLGRLMNRLAACGPLVIARRAIQARTPFVMLESDITDVVYLTWVVDADAANAFVPPGVRLWERDGRTLFTILTFTHGHFGPSLMGPLRRLTPSPLQSNWRFYVSEMACGAPTDRTVLFVKNIFSSAAHAIGGRVFSDALPAHHAAVFTHRQADGVYTTTIDGGAGSAPGFRSEVHAAASRDLPVTLQPHFGSWEDAVEFLAIQHASFVCVEGDERVCHAGIDLPIDLEAVLPAVPEAVSCPFLDALRPVGEPFCFVVPRVRFRARWEKLV